MKAHWLILGETGSGFTVEEEIRPLKDVQDAWAEHHKQYCRAKALQAKLHLWKTLGWIAVLALTFIVLGMKSGSQIKAHMDSGDIFWREWDWWGWQTTDSQMKWQDGKWMVNFDGKWTEVTDKEADSDSTDDASP